MLVVMLNKSIGEVIVKTLLEQTQVLFVKKITQQMIDDNVFPSLFSKW